MFLSQFTESVEHVWIFWILTTSFLFLLAMHFLSRGSPWRELRRFHAEESGASYALSYLLAFPFYLALICAILEATLILHVKLGTVYASFAAARAATVWCTQAASQSGSPAGNQRVHRAAVHAMVPYASAHPQAAGYALGTSAGLSFGDYMAAFSKYTDNRAQGGVSRYLQMKYQVADHATTVGLNGSADIRSYAYQSAQPGEGLTVTVTYEMPLNAPLVKRFFGGPGGRFGPIWTRRIVSTYTLQAEVPRTADGNLGIQFTPR